MVERPTPPFGCRTVSVVDTALNTRLVVGVVFRTGHCWPSYFIPGAFNHFSTRVKNVYTNRAGTIPRRCLVDDLPAASVVGWDPYYSDSS